MNRQRARFARTLVAAIAVAGGGSVSVAHAQAKPTSQPLDRIVAIVGSHPILLSEVLEDFNARRQQGQPVPSDSAGQATVLKGILNERIDNEVVITAAKDYKATVSDEDVTKQVEDRFNDIRKRFKTETEFREALHSNGFGTPEDFRRQTRDEAKRYKLQQIGFDSLKAHGKLAAPVQVTEDDVNKAFDDARGKLPKKPATVAFRQIVVAPRASAAARAIAQAKAESLFKEIQKGADFATVAKRESMDPSTKELGGDIGWSRHGGGLVIEFERAIFSLPPGQMAVIETQFGFHVIRVDRAQPAEVRSRHILIAPKLDSNDVARARLVADTVLQKWRAGVPYDSLVAKYHDSSEERSIPDGIAVDSLPAVYKQAFDGVAAKGFTKVFEIPDPRTGVSKMGIAQVIDRAEGGDYTVADYKDRIRSQLTQEKQIRRMLDQLRREQYVRILFDEPAPGAPKTVP